MCAYEDLTGISMWSTGSRKGASKETSRHGPDTGETQLTNGPSGHPDIALTRFAVLGETRELKETMSEELK